MKLTSIFVLSCAFLVLCVLSSGCIGLLIPDDTPKTIVKYDNVIPTVQPPPTVPTIVPMRTMERLEMPTVVYKGPPAAPTPVPIETKVAPRPTIITSTGNSGWEPYYNFNDGIKVYKPKDWRVTTVKSSTIDYKLDDGYSILEDLIFINTPSDSGFVMIYGLDYRGTISDVFINEDEEISNDFYEELITGLESDDPKTNITVSNVRRDLNYYQINGVNARKVSFDVSYRGYNEKMSSDAYLYMKDGRAYMSWFVSTKKVSASDLQTAGTIMRSFTVI